MEIATPVCALARNDRCFSKKHRRRKQTTPVILSEHSESKNPFSLAGKAGCGAMHRKGTDPSAPLRVAQDDIRVLLDLKSTAVGFPTAVFA